MRGSLPCGSSPIILVLVFGELLGCAEGTRQVPQPHRVTAAGGSFGFDDPEVATLAGSNATLADAPTVVAGWPSGIAGSGMVGGNGGVAETSPNKLATPIALNSDLTVSRDSNSIGIQGKWVVSTGTGSTLDLKADGTQLCMSGSTAQVQLVAGSTTDYDYTNYAGASAVFDLCRSSTSDSPADVVYPLGKCPWAPTLGKDAVGVRFTLAEGATLPRELRVVFHEKGRTVAPYVTVSAAGQVLALFSDASVPSDSSAPPLNVSHLESIELYAFPARRAAWPYSFCINNLEILTGAGWSALPNWVLQPGPGQKVKFAGVNLAGAEFGQQNLPGTYGKDYIYPGASDFEIYSKAHMNIVRLPFMWERLQRSLGAEFDADELNHLKAAVQDLNGRGMAVILDPHNFGRYNGKILGSEVDNAFFADFWRRLAEIFGQNGQVIFGLMNEPHEMPSTESWLASANAAIAAIRSTNATNLVLVPGNAWTGAHNWTASYYGTPNSVVMSGVVDPGNHFAFELHQYLDSDSSGTNSACVSETIGAERMVTVTEWLRTNKYRGFLGEFNGAANETCLKAIDGLLTYVTANTDVWMGWAVWAGGPWWGENILTVQPRSDGKDRPQMAVLKRYLPSQ